MYSDEVRVSKSGTLSLVSTIYCCRDVLFDDTDGEYEFNLSEFVVSFLLAFLMTVLVTNDTMLDFVGCND